MRYQTTDGRYVTAATRAEAAALAAQYGFGALAGTAPAPAKAAPAARRPMYLHTASRIAGEASDWPRCGQGWPATAREREADAVLAACGRDWE